MRKLFFSSLLVIIALTTSAQNFKLGIQLSPGISNMRLESDSVNNYVIDNGSSFKLRFGPIADFAISETYFFSTGSLFAPKQVSVEYTDDFTTAKKEDYKLNYLQIPVALKLYTNEIALDTRIFVKMGMTAEFKIAEKKDKAYADPLISKFSFFDTSLLVGAGVEYGVGTNTAIFIGFSYNRGLINALSKYRKTNVPDSSLKVRNDLFNLDLGVKF